VVLRFSFDINCWIVNASLLKKDSIAALFSRSLHDRSRLLNIECFLDVYLIRRVSVRRSLVQFVAVFVEN